jgi:hypothetical protein
MRMRHPVLLLVSLLAPLMLGSGDVDSPYVMAPKGADLAAEISLADAAVQSALATQKFASGPRLEGVTYGLVGDAVTDNTEALRKLLGDGNRTIHIAAGDYVTGSLRIPGNTVLLLDRGVTLRDSGHLGPNDRLINIVEDDVLMRGPGARIIANRQDYTTGEQRHGVMIYGASNVVIDGVESSGHGGDGFYIGSPAGKTPPHDIVLSHCLASNNRRQGLSITSGKQVVVADCTFQYTKGTAPQFGVDLEPDEPREALDHIVLLRPTTRGNHSGGISLYLDALNGTDTPVDIQVLGHVSQDEPLAFKAHGKSGPAWRLEYAAR